MSKDNNAVNAEIVTEKPAGRPVLTPEQKMRKYRQGIIKLVITIAIGFIAGAIAYLTLGNAVTLSWFLVLAVVAILGYYLQRRILYPVLKLDQPDRGIEWAGNALLLIIYCVLMWAFLLNVGSPAWVEEPAFDDVSSQVTFALDREATVSYVVLDEQAERRSKIDFSNATPVEISPGTVTQDGKTISAYTGNFTADVNGKYTYIRATVDSKSYNESYIKAKIYELDLTPKVEEEVQDKSFFQGLFGFGN